MRFLELAIAPYREGLRGLDPRAWLAVSMTLVSVAARMSLYTFLGLYFTRTLGLSLPLVGLAYLTENLVRGLVAPLMGAWSDRVGRRPVLVLCAFASALAIPAFLLVTDARSLFVWAGVAGAAQAGLWPTTAALLLDVTPPERRQAALGLNYTAISIGYTLGVGWQVNWIAWSLVTAAAAVGLALARPVFRRLADARAVETAK